MMAVERPASRAVLEGAPEELSAILAEVDLVRDFLPFTD
jgi:hypothetical protein